MRKPSYFRRTRELEIRCPGSGKGAGLGSAEEPFRSVDELLDAFLALLSERRTTSQVVRDAATSDTKATTEQGCRRSRRATACWHGRLRRTRGMGLPLVDDMLRLRLNAVEREIVCALVLAALGLLTSDLGDVGAVMNALLGSTGESLRVLRAVEPRGKLVSSGLVFVDHEGLELKDRMIGLKPGLVRELSVGRRALGIFDVSAEEDLGPPLLRLLRTMRIKVREMEALQWGCESETGHDRVGAEVWSLTDELGQTLERERDWRLARVRRGEGGFFAPGTGRGEPEWLIFLALYCKALRYGDEDDKIFKGAGLARAVCGGLHDYAQTLSLLSSDGNLVKRGVIQPCGGAASALFVEDWAGIETLEYELTPEMIRVLGLEGKAGGERRTGRGLTDVTEPRLCLRDIVLDERAQRALTEALGHARNPNVLLEDWGLARILPYGRGVTLLFWGAPGTGKTATAEAVAGELGAKLLVADYSKIQNCYLGQTEKNIAAVFDRARRARAVLFWDEADTLLYDRGGATHSWEAAHVNVLLQEIERFDGVCILATNRRLALDAALERRITAKIEFRRPERDLRLVLWRKLIPSEMPLAPDLDFDALARWNLSGGEIKNIIINAARAALVRREEIPEGRTEAATKRRREAVALTMADFVAAYEREREGRWSGKTGERTVVGFSQPRTDVSWS